MNLSIALFLLLGTALCWQAMDELYKFDKADMLQVSWSFLMSFIMFFIATNSQKIKL